MHSSGALLFKYLLAPFLYEPFRSYFVYSAYIAILGGLIILALTVNRVFIWRRQAVISIARECIKCPHSSIGLLLTAVAVLLAKPSGFQERYPHFVSGLKFTFFNLQDTLPYSLQESGIFSQGLSQPLQLLSNPADESKI